MPRRDLSGRRRSSAPGRLSETPIRLVKAVFRKLAAAGSLPFDSGAKEIEFFPFAVFEVLFGRFLFSVQHVGRSGTAEH